MLRMVTIRPVLVNDGYPELPFLGRRTGSQWGTATTGATIFRRSSDGAPSSQLHPRPVWLRRSSPQQPVRRYRSAARPASLTSAQSAMGARPESERHRARSGGDPDGGATPTPTGLRASGRSSSGPTWAPSTTAARSTYSGTSTSSVAVRTCGGCPRWTEWGGGCVDGRKAAHLPGAG